MIDLIFIDKKQMYDSVITGKENASKELNCIISMLLTSFNMFCVWLCIFCVNDLNCYLAFFGTRFGFF